MTFAKEKRIMLGWMALLAPLPLPLNDVLEWPVLFVYAFLVIYFIQRAEKGAENWLSNGALNILGLIYLPILLLDLRQAWFRDQSVKALMHLILFLVVVKLYSIRREKEKWHVFVAIFFIFVAAMGTSSHLTIAFYLIGALAVGFGVMARFAHLHMLAAMGRQPDRPAPFPPVRWSAVLSTLLVVLLSIPIFAAMPRLRQPFIMGQGGNNLGLARTTGFSDKVDLNITSEIRGNRTVAMRVQLPQTVGGEDMRFKAATYDYYRKRNWYRELRNPRYIQIDQEGSLSLPLPPLNRGEGETATGTIFLEPLGSSTVVLPTSARSLKPIGVPVRQLSLDPGGALFFNGLPPRETVQYEIELGSRDYIAGVDMTSDGGPVGGYPEALDTNGITPRISELARQVMGEGSAREKADRLESHLLNEYFYTTDFVGRDGQSPLEDFLFEYRSGHCEYFASAMVLMLRTQDIPARLVTGFLGAELNPIEDYYIVRQQNAHAWVEAWTDDQWRIYDPTPPDGRPAAAPRDLKLIVQQMYDYVAFRWDRYVLTYGSQDQKSFFRDVRDRIAAAWARWREWRERDQAQGQQIPNPTGAQTPLPSFDVSGEGSLSIWQDPRFRYGGLVVFFVTLGAIVFYLRQRPLSAIETYDRLRRGLSTLGLEVGPSTAPLELQRMLETEHPSTTEDVRRVIAIYLNASFASEPPPPEVIRDLRPTLDRILRTVSDDLRQARKESKRSRRRAA